MVQHNPAAYGIWRFEISDDGNELKLWHPKLADADGTAAKGGPFPVKKESCWDAWLRFGDEAGVSLEDLRYLARIYFQCGWRRK